MKMRKGFVAPQEDMDKQIKRLKKAGKDKKKRKEAVLQNIREMLMDTKKY